MTRPTQPGDAVQHPLIMPALLEYLCMHLFRNEMMIRERDPIALADLTCAGTRRDPYGRRRGDAVDVFGQRGSEELGQVGGGWDDAVDSEGVCDGEWDWRGDCFQGRGG